MSIKEFIKSLEKNKNSSELQTLYKKPKPETKGQMPISQVFQKNIYYHLKKIKCNQTLILANQIYLF